MFEARGIDANFDESSMCSTRLKKNFPCERVVVVDASEAVLSCFLHHYFRLLPIGFHAEAGRVTG